MNSLGGQWHNAIQLGRQSLVTSDFYQPLDVRQRFFVQPMLHGEERIEDIYDIRRVFVSGREAALPAPGAEADQSSSDER